MKAKPVVLVSGSAEKLKAVAQQYGIKPDNCYSDEDFERLHDNPDVKGVYIVLPNAMHREFCERAAKAGKHMLTEKPMPVSSRDGQAIVDAYQQAEVKLMVAYRIQYEPYNRRAMELVRGKQYWWSIAASIPRRWRHKKAIGPLP